jgi:hypothetical protein
MDDLRVDAWLLEGGTLTVLLPYAWTTLGGCAELRSGFGGTLNGAPQNDTSPGGRNGFDSCHLPSVGFMTGPATEFQIRVFDSSRTLEMDVSNPWQSDPQVTRCVGARSCDFHGPLGSSSL